MNCPLPADMTVTAAELARMERDPGPFALSLDGQESEAALLKCSQVVRVIPGRRLVCRGEWQGEDVFIKLYLGTDKLFSRELQGLNALHAAGIAAPRIRYSGTADEGGRVFGAQERSHFNGAGRGVDFVHLLRGSG